MTSQNQDGFADYVADSVTVALAEDVGPGDLTAELVPAEQRAQARVVARETCILCGRPWFDEAFAQLDNSIHITWNVAEGERVHADELVCTISGSARSILTGERTALNFLQLLSATATATHAFVDAISGTRTTILDTRKTIPGLRLAQKYAVQIGGAQNHRIGLHDAILIKENHIASGGGIRNILKSALQPNENILVEIEVETLDETREALQTGAHRLLLDNFSNDGLAAAVQLRDDIAPDIDLEASGGITLDNIRSIAATGVDYISIGTLTKDVKAIDLSMQFEVQDG
ncbi:MAG: carboxylating nicotinate-nucleotide diphosphorylase [Gammaproteobacteria bacterium]|jgi:nicotinate-nucleotide pyrophosphorylase (carboxylating)|nr:carboxylating nicotinate-nucleotide diphosphorylase [Gammaproteobacteria bacterium]MDP7660229.1 carboxylating nicotinate-nucleotide diphosphorylase [Gammaproteobacteria bacterium]